jgi:hypothetical protein
MIDHTRDNSDQDYLDGDTARMHVTGELTKYSVEILEFYSESLGKNVALGMIIESLSETLGNVISLVKEEHQQEVIESAGLVIQQGLVAQQKMIDELTYGQVGHG